MQYENRTQGISFYINSPGGSVTSTLAIYDTMQFIECPIATYCIGLAASGAAVLLAGGSKGRRYALPHSKIMIHQPYGQVGGQVSDIEIQAEEIVRSKQVINEIIAKHTGQPIERVAKDTERDRYLTAIQAKEYGLVDEVVGRMSAEKKVRAVPDEATQQPSAIPSPPDLPAATARELAVFRSICPDRQILGRPPADGTFSRRAYQSCHWSRS